MSPKWSKFTRDCRWLQEVERLAIILLMGFEYKCQIDEINNPENYFSLAAWDKRREMKSSTRQNTMFVPLWEGFLLQPSYFGSRILASYCLCKLLSFG